MSQDIVLLDIDSRGVATVTLNRPEVGNAYNADMLAALIGGLEKLAVDPAVRCLVVRGAGRHFQAGADIRWLGQVADYPPEENFAASVATTRAMQRLNEFPKPTIAMVHGACFGGGVGVVCCVDVAFATPDSLFGITEVRVGVAPTPISTYMVNAIGLRQTRRYALTGERFDAAEALRVGLVNEVVPHAELLQRAEELARHIVTLPPLATRMMKEFVVRFGDLPTDQAWHVQNLMNHMLIQTTTDGEEGRRAFNEKRPPNFTGTLRKRGPGWPEPSDEDAKRLDEIYRSGEY
jgi:methylglutaconyl-CoA hydratase